MNLEIRGRNSLVKCLMGTEIRGAKSYTSIFRNRMKGVIQNHDHIKRVIRFSGTVNRLSGSLHQGITEDSMQLWKLKQGKWLKPFLN